LGKPIYFPPADVRQVRSSVARIADTVKENERVVSRTRTFSIAGALAVVALVATLFAAVVGAFVYTLTYTDGRVGDVKQVDSQLQTVLQTNRALCARIELLSPKLGRPSGC